MRMTSGSFPPSRAAAGRPRDDPCMEPPLERCDLAEDLDGAVGVREPREQLLVAVEAADRVREEALEPHRVRGRGVGNVAHARLEVLAAGVDAADHDAVPEHEV